MCGLYVLDATKGVVRVKRRRGERVEETTLRWLLAIGDQHEVGAELRVDGAEHSTDFTLEDSRVEFLHHLTRFERPEFAPFFCARTRGV